MIRNTVNYLVNREIEKFIEQLGIGDLDYIIQRVKLPKTLGQYAEPPKRGEIKKAKASKTFAKKWAQLKKWKKEVRKEFKPEIEYVREQDITDILQQFSEYFNQWTQSEYKQLREDLRKLLGRKAKGRITKDDINKILSNLGISGEGQTFAERREKLKPVYATDESLQGLPTSGVGGGFI